MIKPRHVVSRLGQAWPDGTAWRGSARLGAAGEAWRGEARMGLGKVRQARLGRARSGRGRAWQVRQVGAWRGVSRRRRGMAWQVRQRGASSGLVRCGKAGAASRVRAWSRLAGQSLSRQVVAGAACPDLSRQVLVR